MATTQRQSINIPTILKSTEWGRVPFDTALGTLDSVLVDMTATVSASGIVVENLDPTPTTISIGAMTRAFFYESKVFSYTIGTPADLAQISLAAFDGTADGTGASSATASGTATVTTTDTVPAPSYLASLNPPLRVSTSAPLTVTGGADFRVQATPAAMSTELGLPYNYTPPPPVDSVVSLTSIAFATVDQAYVGTLNTPLQRFYLNDDDLTWNRILQPWQFNPANGTLVSVNLSLTAQLASNLSVENHDTSANDATISGGHAIAISAAISGAALPLTATGTNSLSVYGGTPDGTDDFDGTGGLYNNTFSRGTTSQLTLTGDAASAFVGTGTVEFSLAASGSGQITGLYDALAQITGTSGAIVDVSYTFLPSAEQVPIATYNATTQAVETPTPLPYSGPVEGLESTFMNITQDNLSITAATPNWFIRTGNGDDAIAVCGGNNVIDAGGGSNFIMGGPGNDTVFLHAPDSGEASWTTLGAFDPGDSVTIWGVTPFNMEWEADQGAEGYKGATLHITDPQSGAVTSLTLAGYRPEELANRYTFGEIDGNPYLNILAP